jgi:2-methylisocitrate lyase-like PEP mutase family enzyme
VTAPLALRAAIARQAPLLAPSIYDGMSALLVREVGFEAAYVGSYATGATRYGVPDLGFVGLEDLADQVRRLGPVAGVPLIVDGESGWGNPLHVARSVQVLERAGAAAIHIEDHVFGKHLTARPTVMPTADAVDKLKAALDARESDDLMIIARTDSVISEGSAQAVERVLAYQDAGVDGLFVAGSLDPDAQATLQAEARVPLFTVNFPGRTAADHVAQGAAVVLYYALTHMAAVQGMRAALEQLARDGSSTATDDSLNGMAVGAFDAFLGTGAAREAAQRYGLL